MNVGIYWAGIVLVAVAMSGSAAADERMIPIASSGDWSAIAHQASITARPDTCIVLNGPKGVAFRWDENGTQLRIIDPKWSLPSNVEGEVILSINDWNHAFTIDDNSDKTVNAEIDADVVDDMFAAMDRASTMTVTVGKSKPFTVSLSGSTKVTNAFRTCAGMKGNSGSSGENPFK